MLFKNELRLYLRDGVVLSLIPIIAILLLLTVWIGVAQYQSLNNQIAESIELARVQWEQQGDKNPHSAAHYGTHAFRKVSVLSMFEPGVQPFTGVSIFLEAHTQNSAAFSPIEDKNPLARFGELTPAFIFIYLFPIIIIILGYRSIVAERENGIMRLILAKGKLPFEVVKAKAWGLWVITLVLFLPFFIIGVVALMITQSNLDEYLRFLLLSVAWLFYFGIFIHLTIFVSGLSKSSTASIITLLCIWIVSILIVPRVTSIVAERFHPVPDSITFREAINTDLQLGIDGHNPLSEHTQAFRDSVLQAHNVTSPSELPFNLSGLMLQVSEKYEKMVYDFHLGRIAAIHDRQLATFKVASIFSPAMLTRQLTMRLSETDIQANRSFEREAEEYRFRLMEQLNEHLMIYAVGDASFGFTAGEDFFSSNLVFEYTPISLGETMGSVMRLLLLSILWFSLSVLLLVSLSAKNHFGEAL